MKNVIIFLASCAGALWYFVNWQVAAYWCAGWICFFILLHASNLKNDKS